MNLEIERKRLAQLEAVKQQREKQLKEAEERLKLQKIEK